MYDETDSNHAPTVITELPPQHEPMEDAAPPKRTRKAKATETKGNGKVKPDTPEPATLYFLMSAPDSITVEEDGQRAAAQAILNPNIRLFRATVIEPADVLRGQKEGDQC